MQRDIRLQKIVIKLGFGQFPVAEDLLSRFNFSCKHFTCRQPRITGNEILLIGLARWGADRLSPSERRLGGNVDTAASGRIYAIVQILGTGRVAAR
jgi:hypothetical protein